MNLNYKNNCPIIQYKIHKYGVYKPRLKFLYNNIKYDLPITDDYTYPQYTYVQDDGNGNECYVKHNSKSPFPFLYCHKIPDLILENAYITLGLGQEYNNAYFKLVVGIIPY